MYVLEEDGIKAECVVTDEGNGILEIKNLATHPDFQHQGYARKLIDYVSDLRAPTPSAAAELAVPEMSALADTVQSYEKELRNAYEMSVSRKKHMLLKLSSELKNYAPETAVSAYKEKVISEEKRLADTISLYFERKRNEIASGAAMLDQLSPLKIMSRGYSLVYKENSLVKSASSLAEGDRITIKFADSETEAVIG